MKHSRLVLLLILAVTAALPAQEKAEDPWKTHIELSYVKTAGNTDTETASMLMNIEGKGKGNRYFFQGSALVNRQGGKENVNRLAFEARLERPVTGRLFFSLGSQYIRDRFAGYDYRISVGPGLGYDILRGESHTLKASVSGLYYFEQHATSGEEKTDYASLAAALGYQWKIRKNAVLSLKGDYAGSLEESDTYFITQESGVEVTVSETISLGVKFLLRYQNMPPAPGIKKTDTSFLTSLILNL